MTSIITKRLCIFPGNIRFLPKNKNCFFSRTFSSDRDTTAEEITDTQNNDKKSNQEESLKQISKIKTKVLKVAVIGVPNAGKSTFINNLINHRVCPISNKVHTTRKANRAVYTTGNTQLILFDTPGLVTEREIKKYRLESSFTSAQRHSIQHGNIIGVVHDVSNSWLRNELHSTILNTLNSYPKLPSFLILNKIDCLKSKRVLLDLSKKLTNNTLNSGKKQIEKTAKISNECETTEKDVNNSSVERKKSKSVGWSNFSDVFMISAITGDGLSDVLDFLLSKAQPGNWEFPADVFTDESPENLIVNSVRARLLDYLPQEIPYTLKSDIEYYSEENGIVYASVIVTCPNIRIEKLTCGESNGKLKQITERITSDLVETFGKPISLTISTIIDKRSAQKSN